jgi:hypothetical protein
MFALPSFFTVPALASFGAVAFDAPSIGAILGWSLIAALVGTGLGILREHGRTESDAPSKPLVSLSVAHSVDEHHREAA